MNVAGEISNGITYLIPNGEAGDLTKVVFRKGRTTVTVEYDLDVERAFYDTPMEQMFRETAKDATVKALKAILTRAAE